MKKYILSLVLLSSFAAHAGQTSKQAFACEFYSNKDLIMAYAVDAASENQAVVKGSADHLVVLGDLMVLRDEYVMTAPKDRRNLTIISDVKCHVVTPGPAHGDATGLD